MRVRVVAVFSYSKRIGSHIIRWFTRHRNTHPLNLPTPSHVSIMVQDRWFFEAVVSKGVVVSSREKWLERNIPVHLHDLGEMEYQDLADQFRVIQNKKYDYWGVIYLGWYLLLNKWFKRPIPPKNKWERPDCFFCCEVLGYLLNRYVGMDSPADLMTHALRLIDKPQEFKSE